MEYVTQYTQHAPTLYTNQSFIDHYITHWKGSEYLYTQYVTPNTLQRVSSSGVNSIIATFTTPNNKKAILKVAYTYKNGQEITKVDSMLLESIMSRLLRTPLLAGIDFAWQVTNINVSDIIGPTPPPGKLLYNAAVILNPIPDSMSLYTLQHKRGIPPGDLLRLYISNKLFTTFLLRVIELGWKYGFIHNDLHSGNVLCKLDSNKRITGYRVIDLGRAYYAIPPPPTGTESITSIYQNEYAKLVLPASMIESQNDFTTRISHIQTIQDCIWTMQNRWIKPCPSDTFQQQTYILFDLIGLLNGLGYFQSIFTTIGYRNWQLTTIFDLLKYWWAHCVTMYRTTTGITRDLFLDKQWLDCNVFQMIKDRFYSTLDQQKVTAAIERFVYTPSATPMDISGGNTSELEPEPYEDMLAHIADTKATLNAHLLTKPPTSSSTRPLPALSPMVAVRGGSKKKKKGT